MTIKDLNINKLTEDELRELNRVSQEKLDAIKEERRRKTELKKNYALKEIPSELKVNYVRLGIKVKKHFETPAQTILDITTFDKLLRESTDKIEPDRSKVYSCPYCGDFNLRVGNYGDFFAPRLAVACDSCDFKVKKETDGKEYYAWEIFHEWLVKNGYLGKDVKFQ